MVSLTGRVVSTRVPSCTASGDHPKWEPEHDFRMTVDVVGYPAALRGIFPNVVGTRSLAETLRGTSIASWFTRRTKLLPA